MAETAALIEYASDHADLPADRLLRRIVAWVAILDGGNAVIGTALHVALAKKWVASPPNMSWALGHGWDAAIMAMQTMVMCAMVVGGVLLLGRSRVSILVLRIGVVCSVVLSIAGIAITIANMPTYASYWSTPASAAVYAQQFLRGLLPEILIGLFTLPPLARRMV